MYQHPIANIEYWTYMYSIFEGKGFALSWIRGSNGSTEVDELYLLKNLLGCDEGAFKTE